MTRPQPHIGAMAPYALAQMVPPAGTSLISLAQNESFRPPSPKAMEAARRVLHDSHAYPDPDWTALRAALADTHRLDMARILCGAGSLDLIGTVLRVYAGLTRSVLAPAHAYPFFRSAAQMANARFDKAPESGTRVDVDALLNAVQPDTGVLCVANPGNPTGTHISSDALRRLRRKLRQDILLIIDEAYGEFADPVSAPVFDLTDQGNTVVLRTFSKAYGLAGCRAGWGVFPKKIAAEVHKAMNPNNVSCVSQAMARAALEDHAYMRETCAQIDALKARITPRLRALGITVQPSLANFLLLEFEKPPHAKAASAALEAEGVFLRGQAGAGLPHGLRMTIGPEKDVETAIMLIQKHRSEAR